MSVTEILTDSIHKQFAANKRVNLFYENLDFRNHFLQETKEIIRKYKWDLLRIDDENQAESWIRLMTEKAVNTFCLNNQFMDLRESHTFELGTLYKLLWKEIIEELKSESVNFDGIQKSHLSRLTNWLMQSNSFVKEINNSKEPATSEVVCSEYSAEFQLKLLNVNLDEIIEPVLDIGCGQSAHLVSFYVIKELKLMELKD
ncbi:MAG: hypothetical protein HC905_09125 [Bacteroidales bacterium]|nr:hypothetical protein [Bacteroidales bacterium]